MEGASAMTGVVVTYPHMFFVSDFRIDFHWENPSNGLTRNPGTHRWSSCTHWSSCLRRPSTVQLLEAIIFGPYNWWRLGGSTIPLLAGKSDWLKWTGKATEKIATAKAKRTYVICVSWSFTCFSSSCFDWKLLAGAFLSAFLLACGGNLKHFDCWNAMISWFQFRFSEVAMNYERIGSTVGPRLVIFGGCDISEARVS